jgi:hypothetical protein
MPTLDDNIIMHVCWNFTKGSVRERKREREREGEGGERYTAFTCLHTHTHTLFYHSWFDLYDDPDTNTQYHVFNGKYWDCKLRGDWHMCPDIF